MERQALYIIEIVREEKDDTSFLPQHNASF